MPKNWIAFSIGANGGVSTQNSGFVATQAEAEAWATKQMALPSINGVKIAKVHSVAERVASPVNFVGVSDIYEVSTEEPVAKVA